MESKFKVGDRVLCTDNGKYENITLVDTSQIGKYGYVTLVDTSQVGEYGSNWYEVLFDDGEEAYLKEEYLELTDVDEKTAFLTELKELMERYQAEFGDYEGYRVHFKIGDEYVGWDTSEGDVTPSNIFDYDK